jgi:hypothetical protein
MVAQAVKHRARRRLKEVVRRVVGAEHPGDGGGPKRSPFWSIGELMSFSVPPAEIPKWRGRRPRWLVEAACAA